MDRIPLRSSSSGIQSSGSQPHPGLSEAVSDQRTDLLDAGRFSISSRHDCILWSISTVQTYCTVLYLEDRQLTDKNDPSSWSTAESRDEQHTWAPITDRFELAVGRHRI